MWDCEFDIGMNGHMCLFDLFAVLFQSVYLMFVNDYTYYMLTTINRLWLLC